MHSDLTVMAVSGNQISTIVLAVIAAVGASLVTGILSRPKMQAEAKAATAGGEVAISGDARAWAQQFADQAAAAQKRAENSDQRASAAEHRAEEAEKKADDALDRLGDVEAKIIGLVNYTRELQGVIVRLGGTPPSPPNSLVPPLSSTM